MFLLIDKPKGITSHDVIDKIRKVTGIRKVGHAGTLDPNATGLLIVAVGRESTKMLGEITKNRKTYLAEICLGEVRDTDDLDGRKLPTSDYKFTLNHQFSSGEINKVLNSFTGEQMQVPPDFSAIKIKGKKAYELARKGKETNLKSRKITIHSIELLNYSYPIVEIKVDVSSGTYIRALARDIGRKLGCGGYLKNLRRLKIGRYDLINAVKLDKLNQQNWQAFTLSEL